jgi:hypothetical protein
VLFSGKDALREVIFDGNSWNFVGVIPMVFVSEPFILPLLFGTVVAPGQVMAERVQQT